MRNAGAITERAIGGKSHTVKKKKKTLWKKNGAKSWRKVRSHEHFEEWPGKNKAF